MKRLLWIPAVLLMGACASSPRASSKLTEGVRLSQYRRIGVMPFAGRTGQGGEIAEEVAKGLFRLRYSVVYGRQLEAVLGQLGVQKGDSVGAQSMRELRRLTQIEAILIGSIDCGVRTRVPRGSAVLLDAADNRVLFEARFTPARCGTEDAPQAIALQVIEALRGALGREGEEAIGGRIF